MHLGLLPLAPTLKPVRKRANSGQQSASKGCHKNGIFHTLQISDDEKTCSYSNVFIIEYGGVAPTILFGWGEINLDNTYQSLYQNRRIATTPTLA